MVDLAVARSAAQWLMTSTCRLERDDEGVRDDLLDPVTLKLSRPPGEPTTLYEGACMIRRLSERMDVGGRNGENEAGGEDRERPGYSVNLPHDAPVPQRDDVVVVTACEDPALVGQKLRVEEVRRTQWLVMRNVFAVAV